MFNKGILNDFIKIVIKTWLKSICKSIDIQNLELRLNKKSFGKVDRIFLKAKNLIYQEIHINKIIIKIYDCHLKLNHSQFLIYSEDLIINCFLVIDQRNLENIFFSKRWKSLKIRIEKYLTESQSVSNIIMNNSLVTLSYSLNKLKKKVNLSFNLEENLIFLEDINNRKKILLPLDKNIKFESFHIKKEQINIELSSKVIFNN